MAFDLEEQEKIDALKAWWKAHGNTVLLALAVFAATVLGVQGWRSYQKKQAQQASVMFEAVQNLAKSGDSRKLRDAAGQLMERYPRTPYAVRAALLAARANYEAGDAKSAKAQLQWVIEHATEEEARDMARLRLAAVLADEKLYPEALKRLEEKHGASFDGLYADLRGDILAAQGKTAEARAAYQSAIDKMDKKSAYRRLVQMKLDALGGQG
jgi:predicted negative regulator of RcsB-dependent stress response